MTMNIQPIRYCIDRILPQGIAMLSGSPKTGKSWLVLEWCIRIAAGEPVWNFNTTKGTTLYLCLEDSWSRVSPESPTSQGMFLKMFSLLSHPIPFLTG